MSLSVDNNDVEALFSNAKAYLMQADKDGVSVYDQLTRLMELLLDENPENVASDPSKLNDIMDFIHTHSFTRGESTAPCNEAALLFPVELQRLEDNKKLFKRPDPEVRTVIEQPDPYTTITTTTIVPLTAPTYDSVAMQNRYWSAAGCGLPDEEAFLLDRSITNLAMEKNLEDIRFVGKIFGTRGDYFIISTRRYLENGEKIYVEVNTMPKPPRKKGTVDVQAEPGYVGLNRYSFWVTSHPSAEWTQLGDVTPQEINAARNVKRYFTGDLTAEVTTTFPWPEMVYLRAQLSRIVCGSYIAPQGALMEPEEVEEDEPEDDYDDESGAPPKPKEAKYRPVAVPSPEFGEEEIDVALMTIEQWVHAETLIYKNGRQTKVPEKVEVEEEEEEEVNNMQQEDEAEEEEEEEEEPEEEEEGELFTPINEDYLYGVVDIPVAPPELDEEDEENDEAEAEEVEEPGPPDNAPLKPLRDEDVPGDDPTKMKIPSWTIRVANNISKAHRVAVVQSLRWPGSVAYIGEGGKRWGCVYFGNGMKKADSAFIPPPAPLVQGECADIVEVVDPTSTIEKLVRRGEEIPEPDSENEAEELEEEEDA